jgi:hypothetical protein
MALSNEQMDAILQQIRQRPGLSENLPAQESAIVRDALDGRNIYEIAQRHRVSEAKELAANSAYAHLPLILRSSSIATKAWADSLLYIENMMIAALISIAVRRGAGSSAAFTLPHGCPQGQPFPHA